MGIISLQIQKKFEGKYHKTAETKSLGQEKRRTSHQDHCDLSQSVFTLFYTHWIFLLESSVHIPAFLLLLPFFSFSSLFWTWPRDSLSNSRHYSQPSSSSPSVAVQDHPASPGWASESKHCSVSKKSSFCYFYLTKFQHQTILPLFGFSRRSLELMEQSDEFVLAVKLKLLFTAHRSFFQFPISRNNQTHWDHCVCICPSELLHQDWMGSSTLSSSRVILADADAWVEPEMSFRRLWVWALNFSWLDLSSWCLTSCICIFCQKQFYNSIIHIIHSVTQYYTSQIIGYYK